MDNLFMNEQKGSGKFPKRFLWGAGSAAHQVEGGLHNNLTVWELENAKSLAAQAPYQYGDLDSWDDIRTYAVSPSNYISGPAVKHRELYEQDFALLTQMNMNAYRFSIEWSRIEPEDGAWNAEAVEYYRRYIQALKKRGIEPIVTLFHFSLPVWFSELGGFEHRSNIRYFVRFAQKVMSELGDDLRYVITINEPESYAFEGYYTGHWAPGVRRLRTAIRVYNNLAKAHNKVAAMLHAKNRRYKVSVARFCTFAYAGDTAWLSRVSARVAQWIADDYWTRKVRKTCDWLGVNYYYSARLFGYRIHDPEVHLNDMGIPMEPANLQYELERLWRRYKLPIIVTENGVADGTDQYRKWWLTETITAMQRALKNGVRVVGYIHWSLTDNFEWDKGRWARFGLAEVNYKTQQRTLRSSAVWFGKVIKRIREQ